MADTKKSIEDAANAAAKTSKKTTKKAAKKVTKKATTAKTAAKKTVNKAAKKVSKKVTKTAEKAEKTAKKTVKKATAKVNKTANKAKDSITSNSVEDRIDQLQDLLRENLSGLNTDKAEKVAKNIWLAGLGAYSRTFEELNERGEDIQDRYNEMSQESQKLFEDLVQRGEAMQGDAEQALKQGRNKLEDRVDEFRQRFGGGLSSFVDIPGRLREAAEKIEEISKKLDKKSK